MSTTRLFRNGNSQAVRIPREFAISGTEVFIRRVGQGVLIVPSGDPWAVFSAALDQFTDDFLEQRDQPVAPEREPL